MPDNLTAAVIQVKADRGLEGNLAVAGEWVDKAAAAGARFVSLPENFAYYGLRNLADEAAAEAGPSGPARRFLRDAAGRHNIWLLGGTIPIAGKPGEKPFAASLLVSPEGRETVRYDKIHLFDVEVEETGKSYRESSDFRRGDPEQVVTADLPGCKLGFTVCYDLRFPELYRRLSRAGVTVLTAPSAFTAATGKAHWELLLRARAVENLCFMVGANLADREHPKRPTWGGSAIIDPWGKVLAAMEGEEGFVTAELDFERQRTLRRNMPALEHRRIFEG